LIARHITFVVLIVSGVLSAQAQRSWIVAPQAAATFASASFQQLGPLVLPERATGLSSSTSWMAGVRGAMRFPLFSRFSLLPSIGVSYANAAVVATEPTTFAINGNLVPGTFEHTYTFSTMALEGGMEARYTLFPFLDVAAGVGSFITTSMVGTHDMTITDPAGVTFTDGSSTQRRAEGSIPERNTFVPFATASLIVPVQVGTWNVDVEAGYRTTLTSMVSTATLTTQQVFARIGVRFDVAMDDPFESVNASIPFPIYSPSAVAPVPRIVPLTLPSDALRPDASIAQVPVVPSVFTLCTVAFRQADGTVVDRGVVHIVRTLMRTIDQGPGGAPISRTDTVLRADPPVVLLRPLVSTDDSIGSWVVRVSVADSTIVEYTGVGQPPREIEWDCATVSHSLFTLLTHSTAVARIEAVGVRGGRSSSAPTVIRLLEGRHAARLDTSHLNVTLWGYEVNSVDPPIWSRSLLQRVAAFGRSATSIAVYGSADGDGERAVNQRIAEQRAQRVAAAVRTPRPAFLGVDPIPASRSPRNDRDRRVRIVVKR
jgi:hypothetical protein